MAEYSPLEVKISVVGYGRAEKSQVQMMVRSLLRLAGADRIGRRLRRAGGGDLPRHPRIHQPQTGLERDSYEVARCFCSCAGALCAADGPRLFFSKSFPGSVPAYMQVTLDKSGNAEYREAPDDELPLKFQLTEAEPQTVFGLADKLDHFKHPLESRLEGRVHGQEDLPLRGRRPEDRSHSSTTPRTLPRSSCSTGSSAWRNRRSTASTWSAPPSTTSWAWIRRCGCSGRRWTASGWSALEQYLPMLDRIAKNESYMHTARAKAAEMAESIRATKP